jgi:hypothetical protein
MVGIEACDAGILSNQARFASASSARDKEDTFRMVIYFSA